jgi:hypothetical protein
LSYYENAINIAVKISDYNEAIELIDNSYGVLDRIGTQEQITKYLLTVCLIHLSRDDWVSAQNYLEKMKNKYEVAADSRGFGRVDDLLKAYDEKEDQTFKDLIKNYLSYAVDNEVLKLANKIVKSDEWIKQVQMNNATSTSSNSYSNSYQPPTNNYQQSNTTTTTSDSKQEEDDEEDLL